ncbi:MAG: anthranilate synthase component I [Gammaproteobacteria bacterium]|nr:anthranilate synthase component I [Pseudomonadales bacterium]
MQTITQTSYQTRGGIQVRRSCTRENYQDAMPRLARQLDSQRGLLLSSSYEYPGRYTRWDVGFVNPPLQITARGRQVTIDALNQRGEVLLPALYHALLGNSELTAITLTETAISLVVVQIRESFSEEQRSRQPSVFSVLRQLVELFGSDQDSYLGLYGAFGYDLGFQFEDVQRYQQRSETHRDLVLYLPDQILVSDHRLGETLCHNYEFVCRGRHSEALTETTGGLKRRGVRQAYVPAVRCDATGDHSPGEYAASVRKAIAEFKCGNLFEVVPGQVFFEPCRDTPSIVFNRLKQNNPAPYGALINLGEQEYLVAASPEMFVRVDRRRIETCPISGTIKRGEDAIDDASQIRKLLNSAKDESELSMCTDVDRNDKARVCEPGSVKVVGRRQIELYSRLIHTVDHVSGTLAPGFDALDGFLAHTWAVTVTGAPKHAAMQFIEQQEKSPRRWYGGAMGFIGFNGNLNTGLTLRTMRIKEGIAEVRAGATLLIDSDPDSEEAETRLKASALLDAVRGRNSPGAVSNTDPEIEAVRDRLRLEGDLSVLMIDHQDSFVHNLGAYFRQCGAQLQTLRPEAARQALQSRSFDLVVLSPGPGRPQDYAMSDSLALCMQRQIPVFGVCLGLQGLVEHCGGELGVLDYPMHGKPSEIENLGGIQLQGLAASFQAGRYHSLYASQVPECLKVVARTADSVPMAVEHRSLPLLAVQFHPESILTLRGNAGLRLVANVVHYAAEHRLNATRVKHGTV